MRRPTGGSGVGAPGLSAPLLGPTSGQQTQQLDASVQVAAPSAICDDAAVAAEADPLTATMMQHGLTEEDMAKLKPSAIYDDPAVAAEADPLTATMMQHGLSEEDMAKLKAEGVDSVDFFEKLSDADIEASGIDIAQRREDKRNRDMADAVVHHAAKLQEQVQAILDLASLAPSTREALKPIATIDELRELALDVKTMSQLGIGVKERKHLQEFVASECLQTIVPLPQPLVLTAPQKKEWRQQQMQAQARQEQLHAYAARMLSTRAGPPRGNPVPSGPPPSGTAVAPLEMTASGVLLLSGTPYIFKTPPTNCMKCCFPVTSTLLHNELYVPERTATDCCFAMCFGCVYTSCFWKPQDIPVTLADPSYPVDGQYKGDPRGDPSGEWNSACCFACLFPWTMMLRHDE